MNRLSDENSQKKIGLIITCLISGILIIFDYFTNVSIEKQIFFILVLFFTFFILSVVKKIYFRLEARNICSINLLIKCILIYSFFYTLFKFLYIKGINSTNSIVACSGSLSLFLVLYGISHLSFSNTNYKESNLYDFFMCI